MPLDQAVKALFQKGKLTLKKHYKPQKEKLPWKKTSAEKSVKESK
jgi:hypothetical protein